MRKNVNLIYSCPKKLNFFKDIKKVREIYLEFKAENNINIFGEADDFETGRGSTYAVFPELQALRNNNEKITVHALRQCLISRGVVDPFLQNKAMTMLLQNRAGIHYPLATILNNLFMEHNKPFLMDSSNYDVKFEVRNNNHVRLIFTGIWQNCDKIPKENALEARIEIDIMPERVAILNFEMSQIDDSEETNEVFKFLKANQVRILERIIIFLQSRFNVNTDLEIDNTTSELPPLGNPG